MSFQEKYLKYKAKYLALKNGGGNEENEEWVYENQNLCQLSPDILKILKRIEINKISIPENVPLIQILTYNVSKTSMNDNHPNCANPIFNNGLPAGFCSPNIMNVLSRNLSKSDFFLLQEANSFDNINFNSMFGISSPLTINNDSRCFTYYKKDKFKLGQTNGIDNVLSGNFAPNYPYLIGHFINRQSLKNYIVINVDLPKTIVEQNLIILLQLIGNNIPIWLSNLLNNNNIKILIGGDYHSNINGYDIFNDNINEYIFNERFLRESLTLKTCCDDYLNGAQLDYKDDHLLRTKNIYLWRYKSIFTGKQHSNHIPMIYQIVETNDYL